MMVMASTMAVIKWASASHQPARTSQTRLPERPEGSGADVLSPGDAVSRHRGVSEGEERVERDVQRGAGERAGR